MDKGRSLFDLVDIRLDLGKLTDVAVDVLTEASLFRYIRSGALREAVAL